MKRRIYALLTVFCLSACAPGQQESKELRVFFAGSLITPFQDLEQAFEAARPGVDVQIEGHGSIQVIRHVTELGDLVDVLAVADSELIPLLMYSTTIPGTEQPYASWTIQFATNQIGLAYTPQSQYADEITPENWYDVLTRPGVLVGIPDARFDACGYRALMIAQLAEEYYGDKTIFERFWGNRFRAPLGTRVDDGVTTILVPELLEPQLDSGAVLRASSVQLLGLLESGDLDYAFEYKSVAEQRNLQFLDLPPEINLGDPNLQDTYQHVRVSLAFQRFATVNPQFDGTWITYGVVIPNNAPNPALAVEFVQFLLGPEGQAVMAQDHHPTIAPPVTDHLDGLPEPLQALVEQAQP